MVSPTPKETLDALFPVPTAPTVADSYAPAYFPGSSSDSARALVKLLKDNHERFHIFFNNQGFHNHAAHHLYAIYTLGASPKVLEAAFETHAIYQRKSIEPPEEITESNWTEHFGDERYFRAYVAFFTKALMKVGVNAILDKYVFSAGANWLDSITDDKKQPQMVNRLLSGVLHPFIHVGYGIEFDSPGMIVEGLALTCVQMGPDFDALLPKSYFAADSLTPRLTSALTLSAKPVDTHSFSIVAQMLKDPNLASGSVCGTPKEKGVLNEEKTFGEKGVVFPLMEVLNERGELIRKYAEQWAVNANDAGEVKAKLDELSFLATLLYGVAGLQDKDFKADFFLMHIVTSSLFLPGFIAHLNPPAQAVLLRSYLAIALTVWVARGRPAIPIASFYSQTSPYLVAPGPKPTPGKEVLALEDLTPNAWLAVLQSTLLHPNEHLPKTQRALAHYARIHGERPGGIWKGTELQDAELLDGTLFVRVAALTMDRLGWLREGQEKHEWDFYGFWD